MKPYNRPAWGIGILTGILTLLFFLSFSTDETTRDFASGILFCGGMFFIPVGLIWVFWPRIKEWWKKRGGEK